MVKRFDGISVVGDNRFGIVLCENGVAVGETNFFDLFMFLVVGDCGGELDNERFFVFISLFLSVDLTILLATILIGDTVWLFVCGIITLSYRQSKGHRASGACGCVVMCVTRIIFLYYF